MLSNLDLGGFRKIFLAMNVSFFGSLSNTIRDGWLALIHHSSRALSIIDSSFNGVETSNLGYKYLLFHTSILCRVPYRISSASTAYLLVVGWWEA